MKSIDKKVRQKIEEMEKAFSENHTLVQERENYLEKTKDFMDENLPANNYTLSKKIEYPIIF